MSKEYQSKVEKAIITAIIDASRLKSDNNQSVINSGEVMIALVNTAGYLAATSTATDSKSATEDFCIQFAQRLKRAIMESKSVIARDGLPIPVYTSQ